LESSFFARLIFSFGCCSLIRLFHFWPWDYRVFSLYNIGAKRAPSPRPQEVSLTRFLFLLDAISAFTFFACCGRSYFWPSCCVVFCGCVVVPLAPFPLRGVFRMLTLQLFESFLLFASVPRCSLSDRRSFIPKSPGYSMCLPCLSLRLAGFFFVPSVPNPVWRGSWGWVTVSVRLHLWFVADRS